MIDQLITNILKKRNPSVVGLDTKLEYLPDFLIEKYCSKEPSLKNAVLAIQEFNKRIIDEVYDLIPAIKLQIAYYEMYGIDGLKAFLETARYAREKGLIVISDVKRNDIGPTAEAYSTAYLGKTQVKGVRHEVFSSDFITVNPYLGIDGIKPFIDDCNKYNKGIFVLVKTSNPSSGEFQDLLVQNKPLYQYVGEKVREWGNDSLGNFGYSRVGAVVGATYPKQLAELRKIMPNTFFLIPGYGAQGGKAQDILQCFDRRGLGAIVNASRSVICAYRRKEWEKVFSPQQFAQASRGEVLRMKKEFEKLWE